MLIVACVAAISCHDFETETYTGVFRFLGPTGAITVGDTNRYVVYAEYQNSEVLLVRFQSDQYPAAWEWKSSDPAVAPVSSLGVVRALTPGRAHLSVSFQHGVDTAAIDLRVTEVVDSVVLSPGIDTLNLNDSITFDAAALDAQGQALRSVPFDAKVVAATPAIASQISVSSQVVSETTTRFTVRATGGVVFPIVVSTPNVRPDRVRSATFTLHVNQ